MAKRTVKVGVTSRIEYVFLQDATVTTGAGKTGLAWNTASLTAYYVLTGAASAAITLATQTVTGAFSSGGFVEVDSTNCPGLYRVDIPDAAFASGTHTLVFIKLTGTIVPCVLEYDLVAWDPQDTVRGGLTALPNAAAGANTGLAVVGTQIPNANAGAVNGLPIQGGAIPNAAAGANTGLPIVGTQVPNATAGAAGGLPIEYLTEIANADLTGTAGVTNTMAKKIAGIYSAVFMKSTFNKTSGVRTMFKSDGATTLLAGTDTDDGTTVTKVKTN